MKKLMILFSALILLVGFSASAQSLKLPAKDSLIASIKVRQLQSDKERLKNEIKAEDLKRNQKDETKTAEELEIINMHQDSVCLSLRSELLSVELQLNELLPNKMDVVTSVYNSLMNQPQKEPQKQPLKQPLKIPQ